MARVGGALGGMMLGLLIFLINVALFTKMNSVAGVEMPTLELAKQMHPMMGNVMAVILLTMIYSTAVGTLYVLTVRIVKPERFAFKLIVMLLCIIGFAISLIGFSTLIRTLYVIMGYLGIALIIAILVYYIRIYVVG